MCEPLAPATLFIGVGHPDRGDDGVGPWLATALETRGHAALAHTGDGAGLIEILGANPDIVIADAMQSGGTTGALCTIDATTEQLRSGTFRNSTHEFGLAEAVEMARTLGPFPKRLKIYGIEGATFTLGADMSAAVRATAAALLAKLSPR